MRWKKKDYSYQKLCGSLKLLKMVRSNLVEITFGIHQNRYVVRLIHIKFHKQPFRKLKTIVVRIYLTSV